MCYGGHVGAFCPLGPEAQGKQTWVLREKRGERSGRNTRAHTAHARACRLPWALALVWPGCTPRVTPNSSAHTMRTCTWHESEKTPSPHATRPSCQWGAGVKELT